MYYYGDLFEVKRKKLPCIVDNKTGIPCKIVAKDTETGEEILLFDGYRHGYNAMFCDEFDPEEVEKRTLVKYNICSLQDSYRILDILLITKKKKKIMK